MPLESEEATREFAMGFFLKLNAFLYRMRWLIPGRDACQCVVGFPLSVKSGGHQIFKWWLPPTSLRRAMQISSPAETEEIGGGGKELENWTWELFGNPQIPDPVR